MSIRSSRFKTGVLVLAAMVLMAGPSWAIYYALGPSKDEWRLKYDVQVSAADRDTLNVAFTLANEGRLAPIYSIELIAMSRQVDSQGGRAYDVKAPFKFETTKDGKRAGQVQIRKQFASSAVIRILTQTLDGQRQTWAVYYDIPLTKYLNQAPAAASRQGLPSLSAPRR